MNRRRERHQCSRSGKKSGILLVLTSVCCLVWLLLRSGRKPSRLAYPCQQASLAHSAWLIPAAGLGLSRMMRSGALRLVIEVPLLLSLVFFAAVSFGGESPTTAMEEQTAGVREARERAVTLDPALWTGGNANGAHDVFVVNNVPVHQPGSPVHEGVEGLVHLLAEGGIHLYRSEKDSFHAAPDGIIASNDVVLLKVNAAWDERGMTNTDVIMGLITMILNHPDGFTGEVVIVENCEGGNDYGQQFNNAENIYQSFNAVVASFNDPARVSASSWWSFTDNLVEEYGSGDYGQGYVVVGNNVSYPKFSTGRGTCVSLKYGIFDGSNYDKSRLKLINVPVLKGHSATGVTGCLKHFMGVPSIHQTSNVHHDLIYSGFMGRLMNEIIYPDLNILDAVWISPSHPRAPEGPYSLGPDQHARGRNRSCGRRLLRGETYHACSDRIRPTRSRYSILRKL
ncbi:MAG: DUF362 domain-containing protein [Actinobacteria bacterium]|nr:DUF362 domain-containing protein [Actinomycetota bacterium]